MKHQPTVTKSVQGKTPTPRVDIAEIGGQATTRVSTRFYYVPPSDLNQYIAPGIPVHLESIKRATGRETKSCRRYAWIQLPDMKCMSHARLALKAVPATGSTLRCMHTSAWFLAFRSYSSYYLQCQKAQYTETTDLTLLLCIKIQEDTR